MPAYIACLIGAMFIKREWIKSEFTMEICMMRIAQPSPFYSSHRFDPLSDLAVHAASLISRATGWFYPPHSLNSPFFVPANCTISLSGLSRLPFSIVLCSVFGTTEKVFGSDEIQVVIKYVCLFFVSVTELSENIVTMAKV